LILITPDMVPSAARFPLCLHVERLGPAVCYASDEEAGSDNSMPNRCAVQRRDSVSLREYRSLASLPIIRPLKGCNDSLAVYHLER
jgi:hypothetical protein